MNKNKLLACAILLFAIGAQAQTLSLKDYLADFKSKNTAYQAIEHRTRSADLNLSKANLLTPTELIATSQYLMDRKLPSMPFFNYRDLTTWQHKLGLQSTSSFGLKTSLTYEVDHYIYNDLIFDPTLPAQTISLTDARPVLSIEQPLWQNGFGRKTKLLKDQTISDQKIEKLNLDIQRENFEIMAEQTYYQLSGARELLHIHQRALEQTKQIYEYTQSRIGMNLVDSSEILQVQSQKQLEELEIESIQKTVRLLEQEFNFLRNAQPHEPIPELEVLSSDYVGQQIPNGLSLGYLVSQEYSSLESRNADISKDETLPTLNLKSMLAFNGRAQNYSGAIDDSILSNRTTFLLGLQFSVPIDLKTNANIRAASKLTAKAAELQKQNVAQDNAKQRINLDEKIAESLQRLTLSKSISDTQKKKLEFEKKKLRQGRTTTFQILTFERDLLLSDIRLTQAKLDLALLQAEIKKYSHQMD